MSVEKNEAEPEFWALSQLMFVVELPSATCRGQTRWRPCLSWEYEEGDMGARVTVKILGVWGGRYGSERPVIAGECHIQLISLGVKFSEGWITEVWGCLKSLGWLHKLALVNQSSLELLDLSILSFWVGVGRSRLSPPSVTIWRKSDHIWKKH